MNEIAFNGIGIKFNISRVAFSIFGVDIYWYGLLIVSAMVIGLAICKFNNEKYNIKFDDILSYLLFAIPISIICARIYYVIFNIAPYIINEHNLDVLKMLNIRDGGLAIYGGLIGGVITAYVFCKIKKINVLDFIDYLIPCFVLGQAIGRWGNFLNIEAYGYETTSILRMGIYENGILKEVHPTFLYESFFDFVIFITLILRENKKKYSGEIFNIYLITYSFIRLIIEQLRTDSLMIGSFRVSAILSAIILVISTAMYIKKRCFRRSIDEKKDK